VGPNTFDALAILVVAFVPGAAYVWAFERQAGPYGVTLADRMMRFLAASVVVHVAFGWFEYVAWRIALRDGDHLDVAQFAALWAAAVVVVGAPTAVGWALGSLYASRNARTTRYARLRKRFGLAGEGGAAREATLIATALGRAPAPRAWDHVFGSSPSALVRMQLINDVWVGGLFGDASYASGYPETSGDIYLERSVRMEEDGDFTHDADDNLVEVGAGILVRWEQVRLLDFFEYPEEDTDDEA
jgi:hypothetical protein